MAQSRKRKKKRWDAHTKGALAAILVLLAVVIGVIVYFSTSDNSEGIPESEKQTVTEEPATKGVANPLTGELGFDPNKTGRRPIAIMINNAPAARPQWGLCSADIVFEGLVEGGSTRMMWVFADTADIPKVGSIRSARHDFVELAEGLDAQFVHWGGSNLAYDAMDARNVDDIDGIKYEGRYFFRDNSRNVGVEHRGYTTGEDIATAIEELERRTEIQPEYQNLFTFAAPEKPRALSDGDCLSVSFDFSGVGAYSHTFRYDAGERLYYNRIGGEPMYQDGGEQMAVTNVLLLYCGVRNTGDSSGHMEMDLSSGKGIYISNGTYENIQWKKGAPDDPLELKDQNGDELVLNVGKSYIGLVPTDKQDSVVIS